MPQSQPGTPKSPNHRCRKDRFRDSSGVPHHPSEHGVAIAADGSRQLVHAGLSTHQGARDCRTLADGTYQVTWDSGITTVLCVDSRGGTPRVVDMAPLPQALADPAALDPSYEPARDPYQRLPYQRVSRSLRRKVDAAIAERRATIARTVAELRATAEAAVARAVALGAVDPGLAETITRLSDNALYEARAQGWRPHGPRQPVTRGDEPHAIRNSEIRAALDDAYRAEVAVRRLRQTSKGYSTTQYNVWPRVWVGVIEGCSDDEIVTAVREGKPMPSLITRPLPGDDTWPPFDPVGITELEALGITTGMAWRLWRLGIRKAAEVTALGAQGISPYQIVGYAQSGLGVEDMGVFRAAEIWPGAAPNHIAERLDDVLHQPGLPMPTSGGRAAARPRERT